MQDAECSPGAPHREKKRRRPFKCFHQFWCFADLHIPSSPPPLGELSEDVEAASETITDQEDQTKDRESGGEKELTTGTGKAIFLTQ